MFNLRESYGGQLDNMLVDKCYYCYTVYDKARKLFYSGVKTNKHETAACLGSRYFTSSTVKDFRARFKLRPSEFVWYVEYFSTAKEAFESEMQFHNTHNVAKRKDFYNSCNAAGSNCGAGSVLCKDATGKVYRISSEEYKSGNHQHTCHERMLVYIGSSRKLTSINKSEYNPLIHKTQFKDHVLCFDLVENKNCRIPRDIFRNNKDRYVGITKGKITVIEKKTQTTITIPVEQYHADKRLYEYTGIPKTVAVKDEAGTRISITVEEYKENKHKYQHVNSLHTYVYDLFDREYKTVSREEYNKDSNRYYRAPNKHSKIYVLDNIVFLYKIELDKYTREKYNIIIKWSSPEKIKKLLTGIQIKTIPEHQKE